MDRIGRANLLGILAVVPGSLALGVLAYLWQRERRLWLALLLLGVALLIALAGILRARHLPRPQAAYREGRPLTADEALDLPWGEGAVELLADPAMDRHPELLREAETLSPLWRRGGRWRIALSPALLESSPRDAELAACRSWLEMTRGRSGALLLGLLVPLQLLGILLLLVALGWLRLPADNSPWLRVYVLPLLAGLVAIFSFIVWSRRLAAHDRRLDALMCRWYAVGEVKRYIEARDARERRQSKEKHDAFAARDIERRLTALDAYDSSD